MTENPYENLEVAQAETSRQMIYEWLGMIASGEYFEHNGMNKGESLRVQGIAAQFGLLLNEGHILIESNEDGRYLFACGNRNEESGKVRLILNVEPIVNEIYLGLSSGSEFEERRMMGDFINDAMPKIVDHAESLTERGLLM